MNTLGLYKKGDIFEIYYRCCLLIKSENRAGGHFRIEPTCIIITLNVLKILRDFDIYSSILDMFIRIFLQNTKTNLSLSVISVLISFSMNLISKGILQENIQRNLNQLHPPRNMLENSVHTVKKHLGATIHCKNISWLNMIAIPLINAISALENLV